jgi:hypothetical protein
MIEGIVGLFVILFLIPGIPFIKDWIVKHRETEYKYVPGSHGNHVSALPPENPAVGTRWANIVDNKIYVFTGEVWEPREGDVWFW